MRHRNWFGGIAILILAAAPASAQVQIGTTSLPGGTVGVEYGPVTLQASSTSGAAITWSILPETGQLPGGLALTPDGTILGAPNASGTFTFTVQADDGSQGVATQPLAIFISGAALTITTTSPLPPGAIGASYVLLFSSSGGSSGDIQSWSFLSGILPPGLSVSAFGVLTGNPQAVGVYSFDIQLANQPVSGSTVTTSKSFTLTIASEVSVVITTNATLPPGLVGSVYSQRLTATGGQLPYLWAIQSGALPPGVSFDGTTGTISGTPTSAGLFNFTLSATDASGFRGTGAFTLTVLANLAISTGSALPPGAVGIPYSATLSATGGTAPYTWSVLPQGGSLPPGLKLDPGTGNLTGIPTASGSYQFLAGVADDAGRTKSKFLVLTVGTALAFVTTSPLTGGAVGIAYQEQLQATGGIPSYSWGVTSGTLPDGLSLSAINGAISGTPANAGTFNFQLSVSDQSGTKVSGTFVIVVTTPLTILTAAPLPGGAIGTPYATTLTATGGSPPYTWSLTAQSGALQPGLTLDPSTGVLAGTPTAVGVYDFHAAVSDTARRTTSKQFAITITSPLTITTASPLPNGAIGDLYQLQFTATGGTPPYTWFISAGELPARLAIDASTGILTGMPAAGGPFDVTIGVKDAVQTATKAYRLTISVPALPAVTITGLPDAPAPATQPSFGVSIGSAYSLDLIGHALLTFAPDTASDDPAVQFTTGGRSADFQISTGTTQAVFGSSPLGVQTGTVAGTITITLQIFAGGADVTPTPAPTKVLRVAGGPPVITSAKLVANSSGFDLLVIGYATTREVAGATVHLVPASGVKLASTDFTIPLTTVFTAWYQDPASIQFGSQFSLSIPFAVQNGTNVVGSLTVTLANAQGTSTAANATF